VCYQAASAERRGPHRVLLDKDADFAFFVTYFRSWKLTGVQGLAVYVKATRTYLEP
jgi:hypothetical protein